MTSPRLEIDLSKIRHNARVLVNRLGKRGISVSGVTKAFLGLPDIAGELLAAGVSGLADSRIENIRTMRRAAVKAQMTLIRSPMIGQAALVVRTANTSLNTELDVISELSKAARDIGRVHGVLLMVELGDLREGIMPADLEDAVRRTLDFPNIALMGIGTNLACRCGVVPDTRNMGELSQLANAIEASFGPVLPIVSGGNSSNLDWALGTADTGRINNLRLGESILLGCEPLHRQPIEGLHTDAITLVAEVIESKIKPSQPTGAVAEAAFGTAIVSTDRGPVSQAILALGQMDTDPAGLTPPPGIGILGSSSDHLVLDTGRNRLPIGTEVGFQLNYSALIRSMASPFVTRLIQHGASPHAQPAPQPAEYAI
ncbi:alanine/ornithine racemase family PLP-dependent enzyme [Oricola thermophila]|uniref:Alanine/ornithine racemase family PLP-dependent enzyme n=1 Tax=Oricola thermophila TaxID=2742145 RepID=A0A6N1VE36_9HYPH|nr:alanine/ornithine racemase family PLP-dependent enzyme [Oricola thermophila]QKV17482.1 alanine/ornithine racemase family PLP-dependent enzyme [Oricola thermophila]